MTKIATRGNKLSGVLAFEELVEYGVCRETATVVVEAGMDVGAAVVYTLTSPTGTPVTTGTGNGVMGAVTVSDTTMVGNWVLKIVKAAANAGDFILLNPTGVVVGYGTVGAAFNNGNLAFTLADGATDFIVGDYITITVAGTVKYKWIEAADVATLSGDVAVVIETVKDVLSLTVGDNALTLLIRGKAGIISKSLQYKDTLSAPQKAIVVAAFKAKQMFDSNRI